MINNCSAPHYTVLLQLGEEGVHMNNFTFMNFVSLKLIIEGEIKENVSIHISNFKGVFGNVLGKTFNTIIYYILIYEQGVQKKQGSLLTNDMAITPLKSIIKGKSWCVLENSALMLQDRHQIFQN